MEAKQKAVTFRKRDNGLISYVILTIEEGIVVDEEVGPAYMVFEAVAMADGKLREIAKQAVGA